MYQQFAASVTKAVEVKINTLTTRILKGECSDFVSYRAAVKEREGMLEALRAMTDMAKKADNT